MQRPETEHRRFKIGPANLSEAKADHSEIGRTEPGRIRRMGFICGVDRASCPAGRLQTSALQRDLVFPAIAFP